MSSMTETAGHHDDEPLPLQNIPVEQTVIGAMLQSSDAVTVVTKRLTAEHFYRPAHQAIYTAARELMERGDPADIFTVADELERHQQLQRVGGLPYLHTCMAACPTTSNVDYYAGIVADVAARRWLHEAGSMITTLTSDRSVEIAAVLEHVQNKLTDAQVAVSDDEEDLSFGAFEDEFFDELEYRQQHGPRQGVPTGYADLDNLVNGLKPGQLVIMGGRPGMGKSTGATDIARAAAIRHDIPALFISLELSKMELNERVRCAEAQVRLADLQRKGGLSDADMQQLRDSAPDLREAPLYIEESANLTVSKIAARAREYKRRYGLGLLVIDYLQLIAPAGGKATNREQEVAQMSRQLKVLARELEIPVVVAAQVNRASTSRTDKRPQLSDLRESGALEADADIVLLVDRPENHEGRDPDDFSRVGEVDLIVAKHRGGATGVVTLAQQLHYCRFVNMAQTPTSQTRAGMSIADRVDGQIPSPA